MDLKQRICATILHGTAMTVMACSSPEVKQPKPLITDKKAQLVPSVDVKPQCAEDSKFVQGPTTDNESPRSIRKMFCASFEALGKAGLVCDQISIDDFNTFINMAEKRSYCSRSYRSTNPMMCGPIAHPTKSCCYAINVNKRRCVIKGRPFIVEGMMRLPECAAREGWLDVSAESLNVAQLPDAVRELVAASWANNGCHEHASIASFASFMMDLLQLGAPKHLVELTTRAIDDEIVHAAMCFSVASAYAGMALGPLELDTHQAHSKTPEQILLAAIEEGCIGETCAAMQASVEMQYVTHPYLKETLKVVSDDESDHAILAWAFVDWMLTKYPELVPVATEAFDIQNLHDPMRWASGETQAHSLWRQHGYSPEHVVSSIRSRAIVEVVLPSAQVLLAKHSKHTMDTSPLSI